MPIAISSSLSIRIVESLAMACQATQLLRYIRLAFSYTAENQLAEGVRRLAQAMERATRR